MFKNQSEDYKLDYGNALRKNAEDEIKDKKKEKNWNNSQIYILVNNFDLADLAMGKYDQEIKDPKLGNFLRKEQGFQNMIFTFICHAEIAKVLKEKGCENCRPYFKPDEQTYQLAAILQKLDTEIDYKTAPSDRKFTIYQDNDKLLLEADYLRKREENPESVKGFVFGKYNNKTKKVLLECLRELRDNCGKNEKLWNSGFSSEDEQKLAVVWRYPSKSTSKKESTYIPHLTVIFGHIYSRMMEFSSWFESFRKRQIGLKEDKMRSLYNTMEYGLLQLNSIRRLVQNIA